MGGWGEAGLTRRLAASKWGVWTILRHCEIREVFYANLRHGGEPRFPAGWRGVEAAYVFVKKISLRKMVNCGGAMDGAATEQ